MSAAATAPAARKTRRKLPVKATQHIVLAAAFGAAALLASTAHAQGHDHHGTQVAATPAAAKAAEMSEGEVRKIDAGSKKITLKHGPLKNLDMPPMTMAFEVADAAMLSHVKVGDKVRFVAANPGGRLTITQLEAAR
jgi:Cu(I)/Ag(I) efflux system periplasmic protein CusF